MLELVSDRPTSARWVVIDDTDPRITYTPQIAWSIQKVVSSQDQGKGTNVTGYGRVYNDTLHFTLRAGDPDTQDAVVSFRFSGVAVEVYITNTLPDMTGAGENDVECWIDGVKSQVNTKPNVNLNASGSGSPLAINNFLLCDASDLVDMAHEVSIAPSGSLDSFFFDRIQYRPSPNASLEDEVVYVDSYDGDIMFGEGWKEVEGYWYSHTSTRGSTFEFQFIGTSIAWYGVISTLDPGAPSNFTYTIDGGAPQLVNLVGHPVGSTTLLNQKFFEIPSLSMGRHKLSVVYHGDTTAAPLTLDYLFIRNGSFPDVPSPPQPTDQCNAIPSGTESSRPNYIVPIVGGALAAVAVLILFTLGCFYYRRHRQVVEEQADKLDPHSPNHIDPFLTFTTNTTITTDTDTDQASGAPGYHQFQLTAGDKVDGLQTSSSTPPPPPGSPLQTLVKITGVQFGRDNALSPVLRPVPVSVPVSVPLAQMWSPGVDLDGFGLKLPSGSGVVRHRDSGVRMQRESALGPEVVELPPEYTPG